MTAIIIDYFCKFNKTRNFSTRMSELYVSFHYRQTTDKLPTNYRQTTDKLPTQLTTSLPKTLVTQLVTITISV